MQRSKARSIAGLNLDLTPPVRLDFWALAVAAGIVTGTVLPPLGMALVVASLIVALGSTFWRHLVRSEWRLMAVLSPVFTLAGVGIAFLHLSTPDPLAELAAMEPGEVILAGEISSPPAQSSFGYRADLRVEHLWYGGEEILRGGGVEVFASDLSVGVGDEVRVDGKISVPKPGDEGFDYAQYLATKRISAVVDATNVVPLGEDGWIGQVHRRTDVALGYGLRPDEAAVVRGMVLGDRSRIPEDLDEAFQKSGITHVLAISGQHVAILAAMIYFVLRGFTVPIRACVPATLALIWLYILIAGAPPSAIRAGVVATLVLAARFFGFQVSPLHFMTTMLAAVLAYNPMLIYSTGFQLSVAAVFGILLLRKPLKFFVESTLFRPLKKPPEAISNLLAVSLAAQIATAPIIAASFGTVSVIGVLTNLIAVPLSGPILTLGLLGAIAGNVLPLLAYPLNASNGFLVTLLEWIAQTASSMPFASIETSGVGLPMIWMFYIGCAPAALAESVISEERWPVWAGLLLLWVGGWLALVSVA